MKISKMFQSLFAFAMMKAEKSVFNPAKLKGLIINVLADEGQVVEVKTPDDVLKACWFEPTELYVESGLKGWATKAKDVACLCGNHPKCSLCQGTGIAKDRYPAKIADYIDGREVANALVICNMRLKTLWERKGFPYLLFTPKGGEVYYIATKDALAELAGEYDAKFLKRLSYMSEPGTWRNTTPETWVDVAVLKETDAYNGQLMANIKPALGLNAHAIRLLPKLEGSTSTILKGTLCYNSPELLEWNKRYLEITHDVVGITTHEFTKRIDKLDIIAETDEYYVIRFNLARLSIINPPLRKGRPCEGLTQTPKYGIHAKSTIKRLRKNTKAIEKVQMLSKALSGDYDAQCKIMGVNMPNDKDEKFPSSLQFPIPIITKEGEAGFRMPQDEASKSNMWKRFKKYFEDNVLKVETDGWKGAVASTTPVLDLYEASMNAKYDENIAYHIPSEMDKVNINGLYISMEDFQFMCRPDGNKSHGLLKNPLSSFRHCCGLQFVGEQSFLHFLLSGEAMKYEETEWVVLEGIGASMVSSFTMIRRLTMQDFDGDQPVFQVMDREDAFITPTLVDWEDYTKRKEGKLTEAIKPVLETEEDQYTHFFKSTAVVVTARAMIAAFVLGSTRGVIDAIVRAAKDGKLDLISVDYWDELQILCSYISEIAAIKKEKSLMDTMEALDELIISEMFPGWIMEAKNMIPAGRKSSRDENQMASFLASCHRPNQGAVVIDFDSENMDIDTENVQPLPTNDPEHVIRQAIYNSKSITRINPELIEYFPVLDMLKYLSGTVIPPAGRQFPSIVDGVFHKMTSDVGRTKYILNIALRQVLKKSGNNKMNSTFIDLNSKAQAVIDFLRGHTAALLEDFGDQKSIERTEAQRAMYTELNRALNKICGVKIDEERPWVIHNGTRTTREFLLALLVGIKDMSYGRDITGKMIDGKRSTFNRMTPKGIRLCIFAYFRAIESMTVGEINGTDDTRLFRELDGYKRPEWLADQRIHYFASDEYSDVEVYLP